ncbi:hypothetical protein ACFL96_14050 [Thermoproteota archaeon]
MEEKRTTNPFVEGLKKNIGREVTVVFYNSEGMQELTGKCEAVDYGQKSVIIRDEEATYVIPRYLYIKRARPERKA